MHSDQYTILRNIGHGAFGEIMEAYDKGQNQSVALKFCKEKAHLTEEYRFYQDLQGISGIPEVYGLSERDGFMAIELLGFNLQNLYEHCGRHFSLITVLKLADTMLTTIEGMHSRGFIHRDIKPDNWAIGMSEKSEKIYLLDFGLANKYYNFETKVHIPMRGKCNMIGNARFCSINTHLGNEQSRRDDLEGLAYMLVQFAKGSLPWTSIDANDSKEKRKKIAHIKMTTSIDSICSDLPPEFAKFLREVRQLRFDETPKYAQYKAMFSDLYRRLSADVEDTRYDWMQRDDYIPPFPASKLLLKPREVPQKRQNAMTNPPTRVLLLPKSPLSTYGRRVMPKYGSVTRKQISGAPSRLGSILCGGK